MKQRKFSGIRYAFTLIFIYIAVMLLGIVMSICITYFHNEHLFDAARLDRNYYIENERFSPDAIANGASNLIYDANGNCIDFYLHKDMKKIDFDYYSSLYLHQVHENGALYTMRFTPDFVTLAAIPMEDGGMFLFLREPPMLKNMLFVICLCITLSFILLAVYTALSAKQTLSMEKMQREYIDNITHELKSPIASVRALTETMYDGLVQDPDKQQKYCGIILNELNGLEHTVSGMLELSRIQNHQIDCSKSDHTAEEIFKSVIDKHTTLCDDMGLTFTIEPKLKKCPMLFTNPALMARLLDILLDNAVKFTGVEGHVGIRWSDGLQYTTFFVTDTGNGISPDDQKHIFSRFYKGDKAHNEKGSGLGLSIAHEISICLGEKLWLRKTSDKGTEFAFTIRKA